jgi:hypothetical protein
MAKRHYTIFLDESSKKGRYFSNFYGAALVQSSDREAIESELAGKAAELNLNSELKWTRVTENYLQKYQEFIRFFFGFVGSGRVKVRIMFCQNYYRPIGLTSEQIDLGYFLLYYQLVKHAFGFQHCNPNSLDRVYFELLFDEMPDNKEKILAFKQKLSSIPKLWHMRGHGVHIPQDRIGEVNSRDHRILQALDIVLGSMHFRLNDLHLEKPEGARKRGKRTLAKERLYRTINSEIREIYPNFNIGISTGTKQGPSDRWHHPYRHWSFRPKNHTIDQTAVKG